MARRRAPPQEQDTALAIDLSLKARDLEKASDPLVRRSARIVAWASSCSGAVLREWVLLFDAQQRGALSLQDRVNRTLEASPSVKDLMQALEVEVTRFDAEVVSGGSGTPLVVNPIEHIERLAYMIISTSTPKDWLSLGARARESHLNAVKDKAIALADLLLRQDGPNWPAVIELFEGKHKPQSGDVALIRRLAGQTIPRLLQRLALEVERQARLDALDIRNSAWTRPKANGAAQRLLARNLDRWFGQYPAIGVTKQARLGLIVDLVGVAMPQASGDEPIDLDQVREWLRPPKRPRA